MEKEEYIEELKVLTDEFDVKRKALAKEFAFSNSTVKEGDVVKDNVKSIIVSKIQWSFGSFGDFPYCIYTGIQLNKDGKPNKKGERSSITSDRLL